MKTIVGNLGLALATLALGSPDAWAQDCKECQAQPSVHGERSESAAELPALPPEAAKAPAATPGAIKTPAQADESARTLLSDNPAHGGYGALPVKVTSLVGQAALLVGARGAWVIGHSLTLGVAGYGLPTRVEAPFESRSPASNTTLALGYGGFQVGYIFLPEQVVHFSGAFLIGGGGVAVIERSHYVWHPVDSAYVFVLEPEAAVEVNITPMIRGSLHFAYRYMSDTTIPGLPASALSGPSVGGMLAFGVF